MRTALGGSLSKTPNNKTQIKKGQPHRLEGGKYENNRIIRQSRQTWF